MEVKVPGSKPASIDVRIGGGSGEMKDQLRVKKKTLQAVLEQCQRALELISTTGVLEDEDDDDDANCSEDADEEGSREGLSSPCYDMETDDFRDLLKSRVECPEFLKKLETAQELVPKNNAEEGSSWDMVSENDIWEVGNLDGDQVEYVLVRQEDIVEGIACFMAAYLLSLEQTKELTPTQLQEALSKTFSVKKKKGKLRKAWDGGKVMYNVASWGATAIGIYQNPALLRAASAAFWTSCHVISKLF